MLRIYSPSNPKKISCIAPSKNIPINTGAVPIIKVSQYLSLRIKYTAAITVLIIEMKIP